MTASALLVAPDPGAAPLLFRHALALQLAQKSWPRHKIAARAALTLAEVDALLEAHGYPARMAKALPFHLAGERHRPHGRLTYRCPKCLGASTDRLRCQVEAPGGELVGGCGADLGAYYDDRRRFRIGRA